MVFSLICENSFPVVADKVLMLYVTGNLTLETSWLGLHLLEFLKLIPDVLYEFRDGLCMFS